MTHNTREAIEIVKEVDVLLQEGKYIEAMDVFLTAYKEQQEYYSHQLQKAREEERKQTLREIDIGDNDYITARRAVAELSGIPMMAITFDEHIKVIKEKLNHSELDQDKQ